MVKTAKSSDDARPDERKLASGILTLISEFFGEGRKTGVGDHAYIVVSSNESPPETETFIDVVEDGDGHGKTVGRYAIMLQKISR